MCNKGYNVGSLKLMFIGREKINKIYKLMYLKSIDVFFEFMMDCQVVGKGQCDVSVLDGGFI